MEKTLTHWKKLDNPDYLGAYALLPGQELIAQIKKVGQEEVFNPSSGKKEACTVCHFTDKNIKPMILNATNCKTIAKIYGTNYIEEWEGKYITIFIAKVKAFGDIVEALRIREKVPNTDTIICESCGKAIAPAAGKTASELAAISEKNTGKKMCLDCMKKAKEEMNKKESEDKAND